MAYIQSTKKESGGIPTPTKTLIWTNSDPSISYVSGPVTLDGVYQNSYDYLEFRFKGKNTYQNSAYGIITVNMFEPNTAGGFYTSAMYLSSGTYYVRRLEISYDLYTHNMKINMYPCYTLQSTTSANDYVIPLEIYGVKY